MAEELAKVIPSTSVSNRRFGHSVLNSQITSYPYVERNAPSATWDGGSGCTLSPAYLCDAYGWGTGEDGFLSQLWTSNRIFLCSQDHVQSSLRQNREFWHSDVSRVSRPWKSKVRSHYAGYYHIKFQDQLQKKFTPCETLIPKPLRNYVRSSHCTYLSGQGWGEDCWTGQQMSSWPAKMRRLWRGHSYDHSC